MLATCIYCQKVIDLDGGTHMACTDRYKINKKEALHALNSLCQLDISLDKHRIAYTSLHDFISALPNDEPEEQPIIWPCVESYMPRLKKLFVTEEAHLRWRADFDLRLEALEKRVCTLL